MYKLIVLYDIANDKCRRKIVSILESYGVRLQKSVFQVEVDLRQYIQLKIKLEAIEKYYDKNVDIIILELFKNNKIIYIGKKRNMKTFEKDIIL